MKILTSEIKGHEGDCTPVWLNGNLLLRSLDYGLQGFFRSTRKVFFGLVTIKTGEEFYGRIKGRKVVPAIQLKVK